MAPPYRRARPRGDLRSLDGARRRRRDLSARDARAARAQGMLLRRSDARADLRARADLAAWSATILDAGQEVQLHLHPHWTGAKHGDGGASFGRFEMVDYSLERAARPDRRRHRAAGRGRRPGSDRLPRRAATAPMTIRCARSPRSASPMTAATMAPNIPGPAPSGCRATHIAPVEREGLIEVPVTLIEDRPGALRNFQICALSAGEQRAALEHAAMEDHAAVTIVSHGFELANRSGTRANAVHVRRFEALCSLLRRMGRAAAHHPFRRSPRAAPRPHGRPARPQFAAHALASGRAALVEHGRGTRGMNAVSMPLRFQIGARTLASIQRQLVRVPLTLDEALEGRAARAAAARSFSAHGYQITSLPEDRRDAMAHAAGGMIAFVRQHYTRRYTDLTIGYRRLARHHVVQRALEPEAQGEEGRDRLGRQARHPPLPHARRDDRRSTTSRGASRCGPIRKSCSATACPTIRPSCARCTSSRRRTRCAAGCSISAASRRPISTCPINAGVVRYDHLGHDPAFSDLSPGGVLQMEAMRDLFAEAGLEPLRLHRGRRPAQAPVLHRRRRTASTCCSCARAWPTA